MEYRQLGLTGIIASTLGFGMWPIGGTQRVGDYGAVTNEEAIGAIRRALDLGVTLFDTAPAYGNGHAEVVLGRALGRRRDEAVVVTKCAVHWDYSAETWMTTSTHDDIVRSAEDSMRRIGTDRLDVLLIHVPDPHGSPEGSMAAFGELVTAGKVRAVGVSNFTIEQLDEYRQYGAVQVQQIGYNMLDRRAESAMIPRCAELGVGVMTYGALCHGLFSGTWDEHTEFPEADWRSKGDVFGLPLFAGENLRHNVGVARRLAALALARGLTLPQLAIAWVLQNADVATALAGMRTPGEVDENVQAVSTTLDDEDFRAVDEILAGAVGTQGAAHYTVNERAVQEQPEPRSVRVEQGAEASGESTGAR
jgi:aryl-alcohol dehydrogenase-like predicted oxidoreductase